MIAHAEVEGYPLDNMRHVGEFLLHARASLPTDVRLTMWKSDIAEAYRLCPMHPLWQIRQINTIDGLRHVDRNNAFGSCASGAIFIAFNSLVAWIAKNKLGFDYLGTYVDDSFGVDVEGEVEFYSPYVCFLPKHQKRLLDLWDTLGIPHKQKKQTSGSPLTIIGIDVDPNEMTLSLPDSAKQKLVDELLLWSTEPPKKVDGKLPEGARLHVHFKLRRWLQLQGWLNWSFNVFGLLKPCLNLLYDKTAGKYVPDRRVYTNTAIRADLRWALNHIRNARGVEMIEARQWGPDDATITVYCDASLSGLGFWIRNSNTGFFATIPAFSNADTEADRIIFHYEALCLVSALNHAHLISSNRSKILMYTDNSNVFDIFNSFRGNSDMNELLKCAADILIDGDHSLRVIHIPGVNNTVADALSRGEFKRVIDASPGLIIRPFQPLSFSPNCEN
ncbi:hypothetical protein HYPSUDRAFT_1076182 [Hypholoma sublateritium FD-334 SS-4]|uniref:Uncharacterized protein n=1 Tax=Hypholoma sublateritium (strain FD-334 SS-4) TaxID=945553 RepID=A0A0D2PET9_HYPSF|nr:hypothetical protein HYPSUDRAFT_1076182 [Hypholoma sublateritium FD-334 SS-4]